MVPLLFEFLDHPPFLDLHIPLDVCHHLEALAHHLSWRRGLCERWLILLLIRILWTHIPNGHVL
jgi:hypothetical protein